MILLEQDGALVKAVSVARDARHAMSLDMSQDSDALLKQMASKTH
jgi:hypothetical protein